MKNGYGTSYFVGLNMRWRSYLEKSQVNRNQSDASLANVTTSKTFILFHAYGGYSIKYTYELLGFCSVIVI